MWTAPAGRPPVGFGRTAASIVYFHHKGVFDPAVAEHEARTSSGGHISTALKHAPEPKPTDLR